MTTAASGRVRRSIRFARMEAQSAEVRRDASPRRERMTLRPGLEFSNCRNTQNWTDGMGISPSGRFRVVEEPRDRRRAVSRDGIRSDWAKILIWLLAAAAAVALLAVAASIGTGSLRIRKLETRIEAAQARNLELRGQLASLGGDVSVCTKAVELNMISSNGAPTIQLTAPAAANMVLMEAGEVTATQEPDIRASAAQTN